MQKIWLSARPKISAYHLPYLPQPRRYLQAQKMNLEYLPNQGFIINSIKIEWNLERDSVRKHLENKHKSDDRIIDLAQFFDGDKSKNIDQKRDIYKNVYSENDSFFLSYDQNNLLMELEVHSGFDIMMDGVKLEFGNEILDFIKKFENKGFEWTEMESGNYLLPKLKANIANSESLGGDGKGFGYFYGALDISHLTE